MFHFVGTPQNELTGEYTCIMLHALERADKLTAMSHTWLVDFWKGPQSKRPGCAVC